MTTTDMSQSFMCKCHEPGLQLFQRPDFGLVPELNIAKFSICLSNMKIHEWNGTEYIPVDFTLSEQGDKIMNNNQIIADAADTITPDTVAALRVEETADDKPDETADDKPDQTTGGNKPTNQEVNLKDDEFWT